MTVPDPTVPTTTPLARELLIAELAVQRAALVTKRVLASLNLPNAPFTSPISRFLHSDSTATTTTNATHNNSNNHSNPNTSSTSTGPARRVSLAKSDTSPVTVADFAAQALLISALRHAFPRDAILGEEDAAALRADPALVAQVWRLVEGTRLEDEASEALLGPGPGSVAEMMDLIDARMPAPPLDGDRDAVNGGKGGKVNLKKKNLKACRVWAMDPIDGTSAFLRGGQYAVALALVEDGREVLGVLGCPNLRLVPAPAAPGMGKWRVEEGSVDEAGMGLMLAAVKGQGATVRPMGRGALREAAKVDRGRGGRPVADLKELHFVDSSRSPATLSCKVRELARITGAAYPGTELYSSHMRYAAMVLGGREFVQVRVPNTPRSTWSVWDHAGSQLIYTESGAGKVTDLSGRPVDFGTGNKLSGNWGLVTADESIHGEILALVAEMLAAKA